MICTTRPLGLLTLRWSVTVLAPAVLIGAHPGCSVVVVVVGGTVVDVLAGPDARAALGDGDREQLATPAPRITMVTSAMTAR
jgi:hypothetical protein